MKHLGSVTDINGGEIDPVDIITFGSPCQDMSVAGKRVGMQHSSKGDENTTRSGLFYEAVRIIREMREKTNGEYPKYAIWENVPGAFTSNNGKDFLCVLEELFAFCSEKELSIPRPKNGKWMSSGEIVGDRGSLAWRTLDAQYWGVPQRRKRIYLVADFDSDRAGKILFERDCLLGNSAQSREEGQGTSEDAQGSAGRGCIAFAWANSANAELTASNEVAPTIKANRCGEPAVTTENGSVECLNPWDSQAIRQYDANGIYPTLNSNSNGGQNRQGVCYSVENGETDRVKCLTSWDCQSKRQYGIDGAYRTLDAGQSCGGQAHGVVYSISSLDSNGMKTPNPYVGFRETECAKCIDTSGCNPACNQGGNVVVASFMGGQGAKAGGIGYSEEVSPTLKSVMSGSNTIPDIVYSNDVVTLHGNKISGTLMAWDYKGVGRWDTLGSVICMATGQSDAAISITIYPTLSCDHDRPIIAPEEVGDKNRKYIIRRLVPTECARLQGFPDCWGIPDRKTELSESEISFWHEVRRVYAQANGKKYTPVKPAALLNWYNKLHTDSAEYKMWGNGIALPCAEYVVGGVVEAIASCQ